MDNIYLFIGRLLCGIGGGMLALTILGGLTLIACELWIYVSERLRDICKAESMIFEYRKNRIDFMYWKYMQKEEDNGKE